MDGHFNKLTPAEAERLAMLAEEAGEIVQAVGKILRHGYDSYNPDKTEAGDNRSMLEAEIGDISAVIDTMRFAGDLDITAIQAAADYKLRRLPLYSHHQAST